ncbi:Methyltransferase domain-containing protein [Paenacidovorax caeni]|jgi:SAM-dependent methyltransferase|uniref:Methyltransferase domain-containing protein n=1 Tax=Paenacidovorax caeni TaxID=343013 RepID=A0A1I7J2D8_9BURK|nr:class I SAM-dependent methyltransferase [Paenacidovorax caeni]SFU79241.1 Methyltransferase domain-containing protein [Paenacidovorax caeni]
MESDFKEYPKKCFPTDFWGQVKRTVNGQPVSESQIALIVDAIRQALHLQPDDRLLDLACGNGALSHHFFGECSEFLGVDFSDVLINVARRNFEQPGRKFVLDDVGRYIVRELEPERFTKVLCYGSFSYFPEMTARRVLTQLCTAFLNVERVFIGNLPDLRLHQAFFTDGRDHARELKDPESKIGIWRSEQEFQALAADCGWSASIQRMPQAFYAAHYRYDVLLTRVA